MTSADESPAHGTAVLTSRAGCAEPDRNLSMAGLNPMSTSSGADGEFSLRLGRALDGALCNSSRDAAER